ncbi:MAG: hypothetical protein ABW065_04965 [Solirubrobacterales bacterium]
MEASDVNKGGAERDTTQDWLLPVEASPPLLGDLEARIDEAVTIARSSEQAVRAIGVRAERIGVQAEEIGVQAVDAAIQARRAADLAERASEVALAAASASPPATSPLEDAWLQGFTERADRVMARLQAVEQRPTPASG